MKRVKILQKRNKKIVLWCGIVFALAFWGGQCFNPFFSALFEGDGKSGSEKVLGNPPDHTVRAAEIAETGDLQLLARVICKEAEKEPYEGQVAIGAVILNRVKDAAFPNSIAGVIYQPNAFSIVGGGQTDIPVEASQTAMKAARDAMNGWDPTEGCLYYWNPQVSRSGWAGGRAICKQIGRYYFGK